MIGTEASRKISSEDRQARKVFSAELHKQRALVLSKLEKSEGMTAEQLYCDDDEIALGNTSADIIKQMTVQFS